MLKFIKKHLTIALMLVAPFAGVAGMGAVNVATASAASCTGLSAQPVYNWGAQGFKAPLQLSCSQVDKIQLQEKVFIGGCGLPCTWVYGVYQVGGSGFPPLDASCATFSGCSNIQVVQRIDGSGLCPIDPPTGNSYHNGIPYWWGHEVSISIHNVVSGQWGPWTAFTASSGGTYTAC